MEFVGSIKGDYYTGFYEFYDLTPGSYIAIAQSKGYINNIQRFFLTKDTVSSKVLPMIPQLKEGELSLVLTWGNSDAPKDLDIHVEFIADRDILCKVDFLMR